MLYWKSLKKLKDVDKTVTLLLPTCPLRRSSDIKKGLSLLKKHNSSIISVCKTTFPPQFSFYKKK